MKKVVKKTLFPYKVLKTETIALNGIDIITVTEGEEVKLNAKDGAHFTRAGIVRRVEGSAPIVQEQKPEKVVEEPNPVDEILESEKVVEEEPEVVEESIEEPNPYEGLNAKQLYEMCLEQDIKVPQKKSKDFYIEKLEVVE